MLPLKLTIQGINSYQQKAVVNFEQLSQGGLFGIFGAVGSGKSTMIDAITLALFDRAEKLGARDKRNYNMMNLQSQALLVDFEFLAGENLQDKYRFVVEGKRAKKFHDVKSFERKKYKWDKTKWLPNEHLNAEEIIGLSYENFRRTVIIPQGKFQEFMQLTDTDRTRMLKEIFGLHRFEFANQTLALEKQTTEAKNKLIGELGTVETVDQSAIDECQKQLEGEKLLVEKLQSEFKLLNDKNETLNQLKADLQRLTQLQNQFKNLENQAEGVKKLQQQITQYDDCQRQFKPLIDKKNDLLKSQESIKGSLTNCNQQLQQIDEKEIELKKLNKAIIQQYGDAQNIQNNIDDWSVVIQLKSNKKQQAEIEQSVESELEKLSVEKEKVESFKNQITTLKSQIQKSRATNKQLNVLQQVKAWWEKQNIFLQTKTTLQIDGKRLQDELNQLMQSKNIVLQQFVSGDLLNELQDTKIQTCITKLQYEIQAIKLSIDEQLMQVNQLKVEQKLADFAHNLKDGEPCALCGSIHHPNPMNIANSNEKLTELQQLISTKKETQSKYENCLNALNQIVSDYKAKNPLLKQISQKIEQANKSILEHESSFLWEEFKRKNEGDISKLLESAKQQVEQQNQLEEKLNLFEKEAEKVSFLTEKIQLKINQFNQQLALLKGTGQNLLTNIKNLKVADYYVVEAFEIEEKINQLKTIYEQLNNHQIELDKLKENRIESRANARNYQQQIARIEEQISKEEADLNHLISLSLYENIGQILNILEQDWDVENEQKKINAFNDQQKELNWQIEQLTESTANKKYDENEHQSLIEKSNELNQLLIEKQQLLGKLEMQINQMLKSFERKKHIQKQLDELQARLADLKVLKDMFRASGFVNFVSGIYLKNLCAAANKRFIKLSRNQLSLEVNEKNQFEVRDHMNGGQTRGIKTLSGGQTFQAALCLALALAEQVNQRQYQQKQFFFIDEGFGSLDKESLQAVYETLQNLAKEGKVIGVISHMESLQDDISTYLKITNNANGSQIQTSWN